MEDLNNTTGAAPTATPEATAQPAATPTNTSPARTGCTGDCKNCGLYQHSYCSAQIGYNTQNLVATLMQRIDGLQTAVEKLSGLLASRQTDTEQELLSAPIAATKKNNSKK